MPLLLLVQEGEFTPFSINTGLIFWTIVVFGILLVLLWKLGLPALLKSVEERERRIQQQLKEREALLAKAREQYEQLLARARKEIEGEKEKAILELRREAVDLSIAAASKLVEANLDSEANRRLVLEYLASLEAGGKGK